MDKSKITPQNIEKIFKKKGYAFFVNDSKDYNINIIGIRSIDMTPNVFNDYVCVMWKYRGKWTTKIYEATTDPGLYYLNNPMNIKGTAIMVPGQYRGAYEIGKHTDYKALRQKKPIKYWRDNNKDNRYDMNGKIYEEIGYTNIHHANYYGKSKYVDKWSAGCQVLADIKEWKEFINICQNACNKFGNSFTYTLIEEKDFI